MKPIYFRKYLTRSNNSFLVKYEEVPYTYDRFHYHEEFEILYHIENKGTRFIGDSIQRFNNGDLVLVGSHMPHYWLSDDVYYQNKSLTAKVILVQFKEEFLGKSFLQLPEMKIINDLFMRAKRGVQIYGIEAELVGQKIRELPYSEGWKKMTLMIDILCQMSEAENYNLLASPSFCDANRAGNEEKTSQIFNYIIQNHRNEITLDDVATFANMNKSAFCRYFKRSTSKTFSDFLNEIRIGFVCKELIISDSPISQIAYKCGYQNVPYFNRVFKKIKNKTPQEFRNSHKSSF